MRLEDLDTPALLIDLDRMERNIRRVAEYVHEHGLRLRPHTKTHKTPEIGRLQLDAGAVGLTVAKVGEAEVMLESGVRDLLIAYPVIGRRKLGRLAEVARRTRLTVALDSVEAAEGLSETARAEDIEIVVLVEADMGMRRGGLPPGEELVALGRRVAAMPGLRLLGVEFYAGHIWPPAESADEDFREVGRRVRRIREDFERAGLPLEIISGGSSPTLFRSHEIEGMNEIRPGTYVFNDRDMVAAGACGWEDCAATILTTVVSTPRDGFCLIDGGSKTFTSDAVPFARETAFGSVVEDPAARFYKMNEEHGYLDFREAGPRPRIGDRLRVIPNHVCVAVNMHEKMYGVRGDRVETAWTVKGRGKLQ